MFSSWLLLNLLVCVAVFSPRVVGLAVVRYDFSSRDTRELSLQEGDVVNIYTKMANGWWRGEVNGRVSSASVVCYGNCFVLYWQYIVHVHIRSASLRLVAVVRAVR